MKNLQKAFMMLCVMGLMISCGGKGSGGGNTPEKVAEKYVEAFYKGDLDGMKKYSSEKQKEEMSGAENDAMTKEFLKAIKEENKDASGFKAIETNLSEDGESAGVKVEVTKGDNTDAIKVRVVRENGKWVVDSLSLK